MFGVTKRMLGKILKTNKMCIALSTVVQFFSVAACCLYQMRLL
jgi:hypothetical protein